MSYGYTSYQHQYIFDVTFVWVYRQKTIVSVNCTRHGRDKDVRVSTISACQSRAVVLEVADRSHLIIQLFQSKYTEDFAKTRDVVLFNVNFDRILKFPAQMINSVHRKTSFLRRDQDKRLLHDTRAACAHQGSGHFLSFRC